MMYLCPKCRSRVFTPSGYDPEPVECANCGTTIEAPVTQDHFADAKRAMRTMRFWLLALALLAVVIVAWRAVSKEALR